jgi:hypothetical protein
VDLTATALSSDAGTLMHQQLDALCNAGTGQFPDAYLADEAAAEDALQYAVADRAGANMPTAPVVDGERSGRRVRPG